MEFQYALVVWKEEQQRTASFLVNRYESPQRSITYLANAPVNGAPEKKKKRYAATLLDLSGMLLHMHATSLTKPAIKDSGFYLGVDPLCCT